MTGEPDLAAFAGAAPGMRLLDLAAGRGRGSASAAAAGARVVLLDRNADALADARAGFAATGAARCVAADGAALPFRAETFDVVLLRAAVHHLRDPLAVIREGARVLRAGGALVLVDKVAPDDVRARGLRNAVERLRHRGHTWTHSREGLSVLGTGARLEVDAIVDWREPWEAEEWLARARTPEPWAALVREYLAADAAAGGPALGARTGPRGVAGEDRWAALRFRKPAPGTARAPRARDA